MILPAVIIEGTLKPDGSLDLDRAVPLAPGRVQVTVQSMTAPGQLGPGLVEVMDEIRQGQLARGYTGRSQADMLAEEAARREEDEEYERRSQQLGTLPPAKPTS